MGKIRQDQYQTHVNRPSLTPCSYLPRAGYMTIIETIDGLKAAYGMGVDLAGFLAAYAVIVDGDPSKMGRTSHI